MRRRLRDGCSRTLHLALATVVIALCAPSGAVDATERIKRTAAPKQYTLQQRLAEIRPAALSRLRQRFKSAGVAWPPSDVTLLAIKDEKILELHARNRSGPWRLVHRYRVEAASGGPGPKLREGDRQVPEGVYRVIFLNANSRYHVSVRLDYPNAFDLRMAAADGRDTLGGDIMIHGKAASIGCLAMGDPAAEELFVLAAGVSLLRIKVIIAPTDFRYPSATTVMGGDLPWVPALYSEVAREMSVFRGNVDGLVPPAHHWRRCDIPNAQGLAEIDAYRRYGSRMLVLAGGPGVDGRDRPCNRLLGAGTPH